MNKRQIACSIIGFSLLAGRPELRADAVTDWNTIALATLSAAAVIPVPKATHTLALVHAAVYDAVNSIENRYTPYAVSQSAPRGASAEAAAMLAAYTVLATLYPGQKTALDTALATSLSMIPDGKSKTAGADWGIAVANQIIALRSNDGSNNTATYNQPPAPGVWQPTPPDFTPGAFVAWALATPFALQSGSQFRAPAPPSIYSRRFRRDLEETETLGGLDSTARTADQTAIALFWPEGSQITWNHIALIIAKQRNCSLIENARLFALLNFAEVDGSITAYDSKYTYNFWRPVTAIQEGVSNGTHSIAPDPTWVPLVSPIPANPDYTSQHAVLGSAAATVLALFFGTDHIPFTVTTSSGVPRSFRSFSHAADENAMSRIYIGFHFRTAVMEGKRQGEQLGEWIFDNFLTEQ